MLFLPRCAVIVAVLQKLVWLSLKLVGLHLVLYNDTAQNLVLFNYTGRLHSQYMTAVSYAMPLPWTEGFSYDAASVHSCIQSLCCKEMLSCPGKSCFLFVVRGLKDIYYTSTTKLAAVMQ